MGAKGAALVLTGLLAIGCGDDKEYGDPIEVEFAGQSATSAVMNASGVSNMEGDAPVAAVNILSSNLSVLVNAKYQHLNGGGQATQRVGAGEQNVVDEACLTVSPGEIVYNECDSQGMTVNGSVSASGDNVKVDLEMSVTREEQNLSTELTVDGNIDVTDDTIDGYLDFWTRTETDDLTATVDMDSDFDVELDADGCAVDGDIEVHAVAVSKTQNIRAETDIWVKAEFGHACGDVAVY